MRFLRLLVAFALLAGPVNAGWLRPGQILIPIGALGGATPATGGSLLLAGETDGMGTDFTVASGAGDVSVKDVATPANVVTNVTADSWWGNAGTSPKLVANSSGVLQWSPHNVWVQSETFDTTWSKVSSTTVSSNATAAPDGTTTADKVIPANGSSGGLTQNVAVIAGATYTARIRAKAAEWGWLRFAFGTVGFADAGRVAWFDLTNGVTGTVQSGVTASITSLGNGWYDCTITATADATSATDAAGFNPTNADAVSSTGDGTSGIYVWGAQHNLGTVPTTYLATTTAARFGLGIDYANGSYGLLVEPAATNLHIESTDLNGWSTKAEITTTDNATTAPDGTTTADKVIETTASAAHGIANDVVSYTSGTTYTSSIYLKKGTLGSAPDWVQLTFATGTHGATAWANFNLTTLAVGANIGAAITGTSIVSLGNGWVRCSITAPATASTTGSTSLFFTNNTDSASKGLSYAGSTAADVFAWGAQVETGTVATSPISTFAATVTRAADAAAITKVLTALPFSATNGSLYFEGTFKDATAVTETSVSPRMVSVDDGSVNEAFSIARVATTNGGGLTVVDGSISQASVVGGAMAGQPTVNKLAASWAANDFECAVNGTLSGAADTSGTLPTPTTMRLGGNPTPAARFSGHIRKLIYLPRTWSDAELQSKSAP